MPSDLAVIDAGKRAQMAVRKAALRDNLTAWSLLDPFRPFATAANWANIVFTMIGVHRANSEAQAMRTYNLLRPLPDVWYEESPETDETRIMRALLVTGPGRIQQLVNDGMEPPAAHAQAFKLNARAVSSAVLDGGREITENAIHHDGVALGYGRMPSPGACDFCLMLASRGAVYTKDTVLRTTSRSKRRGSGKSFHEGCACTMYPKFDFRDEVPDAVKAAEEWYQSVRDGGLKKAGTVVRKSVIAQSSTEDDIKAAKARLATLEKMEPKSDSAKKYKAEQMARNEKILADLYKKLG